MCAQSTGPSTTHRRVRAGRDVDSGDRRVILWLESGLLYGQSRNRVAIVTLVRVTELADALRAVAGIH